MKTSSAKAKGRNFQKWVCQCISVLLNIPWGYEDDKLIQPRIMGQSGTDVILRGKAREKFSFDVECKATENISLYKDIKQAKSNTAINRYWLLFHKKNNNEPIVIMEAKVFFHLLKRKK